MNTSIDLSIVIPAFNEEGNIFKLFQQISRSLDATGYSYEVILVNDGSSDNTWKNFINLPQNGSHFVGIDLMGHYGQSSALAAGIDLACGKYIATMDGDLQNDPSDIPKMVKKLVDEEWDVVAGVRSQRKDGFWTRKLPSKIANVLIRLFTNINLTDYGCTLKVMRSDIAKDLGLHGELHRFIPVLAHLQGAKISEIDVKHHPRVAGKSKYGISRTLKVLSDLMLMIFYQKYAQKPMHLFGVLGFIVLLTGIAIQLYLLVLKIAGNEIWGKPLLLLGSLLTLAGIQLITTGIIAEILMRTFYASQQKKHYRVRKVVEHSTCPEHDLDLKPGIFS